MEILAAAGFGAIWLGMIVGGNLIADAIEKALDNRRSRAKRSQPSLPTK